jgi:hypothetical protein
MVVSSLFSKLHLKEGGESMKKYTPEEAPEQRAALCGAESGHD